MCCEMLLSRSLKKLQSVIPLLSLITTVYSNTHGLEAENWAEVQITTTFPAEKDKSVVQNVLSHPITSPHAADIRQQGVNDCVLQQVADCFQLQGFTLSYITSPGSAVVEAAGADISVPLTSLTVHLQQSIHEHVSLKMEKALIWAFFLYFLSSLNIIPELFRSSEIERHKTDVEQTD